MLRIPKLNILNNEIFLLWGNSFRFRFSGKVRGVRYSRYFRFLLIQYNDDFVPHGTLISKISKCVNQKIKNRSIRIKEIESGIT